MKNSLNLIRSCLIFSFLVLSFFVVRPGVLDAAEEQAMFAGGCFWCLEHDLEDLPGVISAESGYSGGYLSDPTYANHEGHQEVVFIRFDPSKISYKNLLYSYWRNIDPLDGAGQFCDRGDSYRPVIFPFDSNQKNIAIKSFDKVAKELNEPIENIKVEIEEADKFWIAEDYHQDFAKLNSLKYNFYRYSCGRDRRLDQLWRKEKRLNEQK